MLTTNFRKGICADKTDSRQLYLKIIMQYYKKSTSVRKDDWKVWSSVLECQSNFTFHSLLPFIKAFVLTTSMSENLLDYVFHQKHTSVWKDNWKVWRSVVKKFKLSTTLNRNALSTFSYNSLVGEITWHFGRKFAKKIVGETLQSGADLGNMNVWSESS